MNGYALQAKNNNREILKRHCVLPKEHLSTYKRIHFIRQKGTFQKTMMPFKIQKGTYHAAKRHILKRKKDILKARSLATLMLRHGENQCAIHAHDIKM